MHIHHVYQANRFTMMFHTHIAQLTLRYNFDNFLCRINLDIDSFNRPFLHTCVFFTLGDSMTEPPEGVLRPDRAFSLVEEESMVFCLRGVCDDD